MSSFTKLEKKVKSEKSAFATVFICNKKQCALEFQNKKIYSKRSTHQYCQHEIIFGVFFSASNHQPHVNSTESKQFSQCRIKKICANLKRNKKVHN